MNEQVRPTLIIGLGEQGARVAAIAKRLATARLGDVPVIRALALRAVENAAIEDLVTLHLPALVPGTLAADEFPLQVPAIEAQIRDDFDALYHLALPRLARARGWEIRREAGCGVLLVAGLDEVPARDWLMPLVGRLRELLIQSTTRAATLVNLLLLPEDGLRDGEVVGICRDPRLRDPTVVEGCYLVGRINVHGLSFGSEAEREQMVARWIVGQISTPLGLQVAALPLVCSPCWQSFGVARWQFPAQSLITALSQRLVGEIMDLLLMPSRAADTTLVSLWRETCAPPALWADAPWRSAQIRPERWRRPGLRQIAALRQEIDAQADAAFARLEGLKHGWDARLDAALDQVRANLWPPICHALDAPEAGALAGVMLTLGTLRQLLVDQVEKAEAGAMRWEAQLAERVVVLDKVRLGLEAASLAFPAWSLRDWWRVLWRPWRWPGLVKTYRAIVKQAQAYAAGYAEMWSLTAQIREASWQADYYQRVAAWIAACLDDLAEFYTALEALRSTLLTASEDTRELRARLEDAALPAALSEHIYTRTISTLMGELTAACNGSRSLSAWVADGFGADGVVTALEDYAWERFAFLQETRLDTLLARTYGSTELRARLAELMEGAGPFWPVHDDAGCAPKLRTWAWLGLPNPDDSPLVDLLPDRSVMTYTTGDPGEITAVQVAVQDPESPTFNVQHEIFNCPKGGQ